MTGYHNGRISISTLLSTKDGRRIFHLC